MSNKRELKRQINYICSDLFAECVASSLYADNRPTEEDIDALLTSIMLIHSDFISRVSHPEPGMPAKKYFRALIVDFNKQVNELIDQICNQG